MTDGKPLRQFAELGLAAVGIEYDQTNQTAFDEQFEALQNFVRHQTWSQSNSVAWVGMSLGARRTLQFLLSHPGMQPQLVAQLSGCCDEEFQARFPFQKLNSQFENNQSVQPATNVTPIRCSFLFVHSEDDAIFPIEDTKRLAELLETNRIPVNLRIFKGVGHDFGADWWLVLRQTAEYCRAHLLPADYTATLPDCQLDEDARQRFNLAMQRAAQHRCELWKAVVSSREPERHTLMTVIGGLEDYDLAHVQASYLKKNVQMAWRARRIYPWCRNTPLDIFEKYVAGSRFFQEPIENWRPVLNHLVRDEVKYCRATQQASDKVWRLMNEKAVVDLKNPTQELAPLRILDAGKGNCLRLCILHAAMARSVGLAERVTRVVWQNSLHNHYCVEVWSTEDQRWHEIDVTAGDRAFNNDWILRVPKTAILTCDGDRGLWDGLSVGCWTAYTNTIGLVYPSGDVVVRVLDHGIPAPDRTVGIKLPTVKGLFSMALARTDLNGEAQLTLGRNAQYPYLFFVLPPDAAAAGARYPFSFPRPDFGDITWRWVQVQSGHALDVTLNLEDRRPFDPETKPPELRKPL